MVLVSHDMRLISQVANEIWICDNKTITQYKGDIQSFKMDMRAQMGIEGSQVGKLRGDASVQQGKTAPKNAEKKEPAPPLPKPSPPHEQASPAPIKVPDDATTSTGATADSSVETATPVTKPVSKGKYIPPHLRKKMMEAGELP